MQVSFQNLKRDDNIILSHKSILILGKADTEYKNLKIISPNNIDEVESIYGKESQLTKAYIESIKAGASEVYLCNCFKFTDYIHAIELIAQNDFAFVCPLFSFSTTYINPKTKKKIYFAEMYAEALEHSFSNLMLTEKHASLYEDIIHYLLSMKSINRSFKNSCSSTSRNLQCLSFTLNNLEDYKFANIALSAMIAESNLREYPKKEFGKVVFDIDKYDCIQNEFSYFSYDSLAGTNVENLLNYNQQNNADKLLLISIIKNRINMALDYDQFSGQLINSYTKIKIDTYTRDVLNKLSGTLIESYDLKDIIYTKLKSNEVDIYIFISIKPYASIENIDLKIEV